jgi:glycosyltransferase 2 family protein
MKELNKSNFRRGIRLFFFLSIATVAVILFLTVSEETIKQLKLISPLFLLLTFFSTSLRFAFDIWRLRYIVKALGKEITWKGAFYFTMGGLAFGAITPMQIGGIPFQLYICKKEEITIPEGTAAIFSRGFLSALVLPFLIPFIYYYRQYMTSGIMSAIVKYLMIFYGIFAVIFILLLTQTSWLERKFGDKVKGVVTFKRVFSNEFMKRKWTFFKAYVMTFFSLTFYFLTAPLLIRGLGIEAPFFEATILQVVMTYAVNFLPTPGASGLAEGGAAAIFNHLMPTHILGIYVTLWRFFTSYVGVLVGVLAISRFVTEKKGLSHEDTKAQS